VWKDGIEPGLRGRSIRFKARKIFAKAFGQSESAAVERTANQFLAWRFQRTEFEGKGQSTLGPWWQESQVPTADRLRASRWEPAPVFGQQACSTGWKYL
jgi:hypothetical protein